MKEVFDRTRSKRPFMVAEDSDVQAIEAKRDQLLYEIEILESTIENLEDPYHQQLALESKDRMLEIALAAMTIDPSDTVKISRAQGQFAERKFLTERIANVRIEIQEKKNFLTQLTNRVQDLMSKLKKESRK